MATSGAERAKRGPAPIASFDHDASDESSPESKRAPRLPGIREVEPAPGASLAPPEPRARSHSTPAAAAPRIDISRASSSSHHDSRDSSPELALFAGAGGDDGRARLELGFREDGALDLRSSTEELAFLEGAPGRPAGPAAPAPHRPSRRDSQGSEAALLAVSGRTSRISSVGSQCSALSALSHASCAGRASRLSAVSGASRSPSPHRMLLETSFCGPKPIETDPEICAAAVEERLLEMAKLSVQPPPPPAGDARDRREVRTEATVERTAPPTAPAPAPPDPPPAPVSVAPAVTVAPSTPTPAAPDDSGDDKRLKETQNRARAQERRARPRVRREPSEPEVYKSGNRTKDIIRIKLKPDEDYDDDEEISRTLEPTVEEPARRPEPGRSADAIERAVRPTELAGRVEPDAGSRRGSRTPSPHGPPVSRKSSFCSLFKSRETIASPDSPSGALLRKRSLTEGRSRSKSRDRSTTPSAGGKVRGSVLSLFRTPRRSLASPAPSSRDASPAGPAGGPPVGPPAERSRRAERLKYYEDTSNGIIHIPLRTPPDERPGSGEIQPELAQIGGTSRELPGSLDPVPSREATSTREVVRPASAPQPRTAPSKPTHRTVLPDGSIIIPLHSPTERDAEMRIETPPAESSPPPTIESKIEVVPAPAATSRVETRAEVENGPVASPSSGKSDGSSPPERPEVVEREATAEDTRRRRERIVFTTHVGSRDQVFSTRLSITKTPSVASEISGSLPSFECEEPRPASRDSSGSEASSGSAARGDDAERRGLVVQESFEDELPYVPTTLPQERPLALPMVPVRDRGTPPAPVATSRPRAAAPRPPVLAPAPAPLLPPTPATEKLRIRLPRRPRTASTSAAPPRPDRVRTRSGSDGGDASRPKTDWIDFEEVPERRKQPKRIQTLPAAGGRDDAGPGGVVFSYVEPDQCRCECHAHAAPAPAPAADQLPLLAAEQHTRLSSPPEGAPEGRVVRVRPSPVDRNSHAMPSEPRH